MPEAMPKVAIGIAPSSSIVVLNCGGLFVAGLARSSTMNTSLPSGARSVTSKSAA